MVRFAQTDLEMVEHVVPSPSSPQRREMESLRGVAAAKIHRVWRRWIARRAGPLLRFREESNNPFDFFSTEPVETIPFKDFVSFVDAGKGYCMDSKSAVSLLEHAAKTGETPLNPFNRAALPSLFLRRIALHTVGTGWSTLQPMSDLQKFALDTTDLFRHVEDLGYYSDPSWFLELSRQQLQRLYMELADIWFHRAALSAADRQRIVPGINPFRVPIQTALIMQQKALRPLLLKTCTALISSAPVRSDKQLGTMYLLGAMSIISAGAGTAYPWLYDMFAPGVTRIVGSELVVLHPSVLTY